MAGPSNEGNRRLISEEGETEFKKKKTETKEQPVDMSESGQSTR